VLELKLGKTLVLEAGIVLHSLPNQSFYYAFNVVNGDEFRLNRTSFWILEAIGKGIQWSHLKDAFLTAFEVSAQQGEADLRQLVGELYEQKIIRKG
jgi:hypothetical protein